MSETDLINQRLQQHERQFDAQSKQLESLLSKVGEIHDLVIKLQSTACAKPGLCVALESQTDTLFRLSGERESRLRNVETICEVTAKTVAQSAMNLDKITEKVATHREKFAEMKGQTTVISAIVSGGVAMLLAFIGWIIALFKHS